MGCLENGWLRIKVLGELDVQGDAMKIKHPDFLIRLDDFWKDFTVILYQDGMGRSVAHSRGDMRDTVSVCSIIGCVRITQPRVNL